MKKLFDAIRYADLCKLYMVFHWSVLISLWLTAFYYLAMYEFGNVLCMGVLICAWKMKGVEE